MARAKRELTQAEIAKRAAEIRAGWSEREFRKRAGVVETRWTPPFVTPVDSLEENLPWFVHVHRS